MRSQPFEQRRAAYTESRIENQLRWYAMKSRLIRRSSNAFFGAFIAINVFAVVWKPTRFGFSPNTRISDPWWRRGDTVRVHATYNHDEPGHGDMGIMVAFVDED